GPGRGSEVTISLPAAPVPASATPQPVPGRGAARARRVLIIDDNPDSANSLRDVLALGGHDARVAHDRRAGLAGARGVRPEIVICDIGLPDMDGYAVARAFRGEQTLKETYLVALSGYARSEDLQRATAAGFDQHLTKPPLMNELDRIMAGQPQAQG